MNISDWIALATLIVFALQLIVLVLGYFGIIKETNKNARERQIAIDDTADKFRSLAERTKEGLNKEVKRNSLILLALGAILGILLFTINSRLERTEAKEK